MFIIALIWLVCLAVYMRYRGTRSALIAGILIIFFGTWGFAFDLFKNIAIPMQYQTEALLDHHLNVDGLLFSWSGLINGVISPGNVEGVRNSTRWLRIPITLSPETPKNLKVTFKLPNNSTFDYFSIYKLTDRKSMIKLASQVNCVEIWSQFNFFVHLRYSRNNIDSVIRSISIDGKPAAQYNEGHWYLPPDPCGKTVSAVLPTDGSLTIKAAVNFNFK